MNRDFTLRELAESYTASPGIEIVPARGVIETPGVAGYGQFLPKSR